MKAVGYDLLTPGNHDWNYGKDRLKGLGEMSGLEILAGNITQDGTAFFGNEKTDNGTYVTEVTDPDGDSVKVGVLGVFDQDIVKDTAPSNVEGLNFANDAETATAPAKQLRAGVRHCHCSLPSAGLPVVPGSDRRDRCADRGSRT